MKIFMIHMIRTVGAMITVSANATVGCGVYPRPEWEGVKPSPTMAKTMVKAAVGILSILLFVWTNAALSEETAMQPPAFAGQWPYHASKGIAMDDIRNLIFLGDGDRLDILDMDLNPVSTMAVTQTGLISALFYDTSDQILYIACKNNGLRMVDVSDPANLHETSSYVPASSTTEVNAVFVEGVRAYIAGGVDGLFILDVTDPASPTVFSQSKLPGGFGISYAVDVVVSGNFAYVADLYTGIHIVDVTDPAKPSYKKGIALPGSHDLAIVGNYLYTTMEGNGMAITDITTPTTPTVDSLFNADGTETAVRMAGELAYIGYSKEGLRVVDVTDPKNPVHNTAWAYTASGCSSIGLGIDTAALYMTSDQTGLERIDITDKSAMQAVAVYDTPADAVAVAISGEYAVILDDNAGTEPKSEGLRIVQISPFNESVQLYLKGFCATPGNANDVVISGDMAVVADGEEGLQLIDITDKTAPVRIGSCDTPGFASGVSVSGDYAFIADGEMGMAVVDITNRTAPVMTASMDTPGVATKVAATGNYAFIADGEAGLQIVDVTDKTAPVIIKTLDTPGTAFGLFVSGNTVFIADGDKGMVVADVTDKSAPSIISSVDTPGFAGNISVIGNYAYVADGEKGMAVVNVTDPALPVKEDNLGYDSNGFCSDISSGYTSDDEALFAFIADGPAGMIALNLVPVATNTPIDPGGSGGACFIQAAGR